MKKVNGLILLLCALSINVYANPTEITKTTITEKGTASENEYGDVLRYKSVKINTPTFKVDKFWSKFSDSKDNQAEFKNIATQGLFELTIQQSFACKVAGLNENGCSGQKPFLVNDGYMDNPDLKLDSLGNALPKDEIRIPYDSAVNYNTANDDAFYALDVYRTPKYYKKDEAPVGSDKKSFFGIIKSFFHNYFTPKTATYGDPLDAGSIDARDRYIANIIFGFEKDYRVKKNSKVDVTTTNAANNSGKISLLDYNAQTIKTSNSCSGFFITYNSGSASCQVMNFFGMANWMPFFSNNSEKEINSKSVMQDTEDTLLTLAGKLDGKNYILDKTELDKEGRRSFVGEIFKPMTNVMGSMFRFFFGNSSSTTTEMISANFDFVNQMPLTFLVTDGAKILGFDSVKLLGIESVYGTEATSCTVKNSSGLNLPIVGSFGPSTKTTYTQGIITDTIFDGGKTRGILSDDDEVAKYPDLNRTYTTYQECLGFGMFGICLKKSTEKKYKIHVSTQDWLDWCKRNQGRQKKGLFGRIFDKFTNISNFLVGKSGHEAAGYDNQLDTLLSGSNFFFSYNDKYTVVEYKEKVHHGLILHVKKVDADELDIGSVGTTTSYKLMSISKGTSNHDSKKNNAMGGHK